MGAPNVTAIAEAVVAAAAALPPDVNPFAWYRDRAFDRLVPETGPAFWHCLEAIIALAGTALLLSLSIVALKIRCRTFWLFRTRIVPKGYLIAPNTSLLILMINTVHFIVTPITVVFMLKAFRDGNSPPWRYHAMQGITWLPVVLIGWTAAHGQACSLYLAVMRVTPTAQGNQRFIRMQAKLGHCGMCSRVVNYLFLAGYIVMSVPLLSFFWFAAHKWRVVWNMYMSTVTAFDALIPTWQPGDAYTAPPDVAQRIANYVMHAYCGVVWLGRSFLCLAVEAMVTLVIYLPLSLCYLAMLYSQIKAYKQDESAKGSESTSTADRKHFSTIRATYRSLCLETVLCLSFYATNLASATWLGTDTYGVLSKARNVQTLFEMSFFIFEVYGVLFGCLMLYRTWKQYLELRSSGALDPIVDRRSLVLTRNTDVTVLSGQTHDEGQRIKGGSYFPFGRAY